MQRENFYLDLLKDFNNSSSAFKHIKDKSLNFKSDEGQISFDFFTEKDKRRKRTFTHIFFNKNTNVKVTCDYLNQHFRSLLNTDLFIYIARTKQKNSKTVETVKSLLNTNSRLSNEGGIQVDYVQDILIDISSRFNKISFKGIEYDTPKVFINPAFLPFEGANSDEKIADNAYINNWYKQENSPLLVILGKAGIGKTTVAQFFSNEIIRDRKNLRNIFINSAEVKKRLIDDYEDASRIDLYDIYKSSSSQKEYLDKKLFKYNLDTGNIFLIIDGIDELISKVKNFDLSGFIRSVNDLNQQLKNSKIIITCRNEYWEDLDIKCEIVNLLPFDIIQSEKFFAGTYNKKTDDRIVKKSLELAREIHKNESSQTENLYHPYALDLISKVIMDKANIKDKDIDSEIFDMNIETDYILAKMCYRENYLSGKTRITNLSVDQQIMIFQYISIVHGGIVNWAQLADAIFFGLNKNITNEQDLDEEKLKKLSESFSSHPFLDASNQTEIKFSYDFLNDYFKSSYIAHYIDYDDLREISRDFLSFLEDCTFDSDIVKDIARRVKSLNEKRITNLKFLMLEIEAKDFKPVIKMNLFSGVFNIAYHINSSQNDKVENTVFINKLFSENKIENLCLVNIKDKLEFDFSEIDEFRNCHFQYYNSFWSNTIARKNRFYNCSFIELGTKTSKSTLDWVIDKNYTNFDFNSGHRYNKQINFGMDTEFIEQFNKTSAKDELIKEEVKQFVSKFIHFFWHNNHFQSQNLMIEDDACKYPLKLKFSSFGSIPINFERFIEIVDDLNILEYPNFQGIEKVNISKAFRPELSSYIKQKNYSEIFNELIEKVYTEIR